MDHIELPVDRDPLEITVPYLVTPEVEYDGEDFATFPTRKGFNVSRSGKLGLAALQEKPAKYAVGFVQAWLYFGLLKEVLGPDYHEADWRIDDRICTKGLPAIISAQKTRIRSLVTTRSIRGPTSTIGPVTNGSWTPGWGGGFAPDYSEERWEISRISELVSGALK